MTKLTKQEVFKSIKLIRKVATLELLPDYND